MQKPLRVLHVVVNMNRGGAETFLMNVYRTIDKSKVQFDFLTCYEGVYDEEILDMGGRIHRIPYINKVGPFKYNYYLRNFFKENPDYLIVHSHMDKMSGLVLKAAKKHKAPIRISHSHSTRGEGGWFTRLYKWYAGLYLRNSCTNYMACSKVAAKWLFGKESSNTQLVMNGIELKKYSRNQELRNSIRSSLNIPDNTIVIGHVGRFSKPKNHSFLIDIFNELIKLEVDCKLVLVGDGILMREIKEKVESLNLSSKVIFLGVRDDVDKILNIFDAFIFPSLFEGLPVTLIEAQAMGLPCIISNNITKEVVVSDDLMKFLPLGNPKIWAEEILRLNTSSKVSSHQLLRNQGYDISATTNFLQNFYLESLSR